MTTALMTKSFAQLPIPTSSLDAYMQAAGQIPVLSVEEERKLAKRLHEQGDLDAAKQLIMSHLRFVIHIARSYSGYGLPLGDLIQEGNIGLMKAVKRFDPSHKVRLVSFAVHWIKAEIHEFVLRNWRIVKVATTKSQRKLFFNLRGAKKQLGWLSQQEAEAIASDLGVKTQTVFEMESRLSGHDVSYDPGPDVDDDQEFSAAPAAYLQDRSSDPALLIEDRDWETQSNAKLAEALQNLDARSKDIVSRRWLSDDKPTLQTLADEYEVSAERIRQLESAAMKKIKTQLLAD